MRSYRTAWAFGLVAVVAGSSALPAQSAPPDSMPRMHIHPALGIRVGTPQRVSVALGVVTGPDLNEAEHPRSPDLALFVEPGWSAGRASVGIASFLGNLGRGWGASATVLRTWNDSWLMSENNTYVGGELWIWPAFAVGPRLGIFHSITGRRGWFVTGDIGVGF